MKKLIALATVAVLSSTAVASAQAVQPVDSTTSTQTTPNPLLIALIAAGIIALSNDGGDSTDSTP